MKIANNILLKALGVLLLTGAILKGYQLITEPLANKDIFSYRPFLIFTVEFELALAIWLLSGLFKKLAWLVSLACFSLFSLITLYKALSGAESCGCFGSVQVNPWITLFAIDIPAVIALAVFRPRAKQQSPNRKGGVRIPFRNLLFSPRFYRGLLPQLYVGGLLILVTTLVLAFNAPANVTSSYIVLEPETWVGKELPILDYIDIGDKLRKGNWLVLFYHYDCPECIEAVPRYEQMARDLKGNEDFMRIALIEVPPYGPSVKDENCCCTHGCLVSTKEWFITTPAVVLLENSTVRAVWERKTPDLDAVLNSFAKLNKSLTSKSGPERR